VAVIQISKIQLRRGKKLTGNGVPQLSSAEFAWAIDTQELYIGNGSLAEGAPYVGNTKILTEHDNILELASSYRFGSDDPSIVNSIFRSVQSKLDEIEVSVVDFGAVPDGSTDCTAAFHAAFEDLFLKTDDKLKKVLKVPNGVYLFFSDLKIPSRATIRGENQYETVLEIGNNNIVFVSENETEPGSFTSSDVPRKIRIENLTIDHQDGQTIISASKDCIFDKVRWQGNYSIGDPGFVPQNANAVYNIPIVSTGGNITVSGSGVSVSIVQTFSGDYANTLGSLVGALNADPIFSSLFIAEIQGTSLKIVSQTSGNSASSIDSSFIVDVLPSNEVGTISVTVSPILSEDSDGSENVTASIFWENKLFGIRTTDNYFIDCGFSNTKLAVKCLQDQSFETNIYFDRCRFLIGDTSIYIDGVTDFSVIPTVYQENRWKIENSYFEKIATRVIDSTAGIGTQIINCRFIGCGNGINTSQYPITSLIRFGQSIENIIIDCSSDRHRLSGITNLETVKGQIEYEGASFVRLIDRNYAEISLSDSLRPLAVFSADNNSIIIDYVLTVGSHSRTGTIHMSVNTNNSAVALSDNYTYSSGGLAMTNFQFDAELRNNDTVAGNETVLLKYVNPLISGSTGSISYSVSYGV
jgi:hypothetical protein